VRGGRNSTRTHACTHMRRSCPEAGGACCVAAAHRLNAATTAGMHATHQVRGKERMCWHMRMWHTLPCRCNSVVGEKGRVHGCSCHASLPLQVPPASSEQGRRAAAKL